VSYTSGSNLSYAWSGISVKNGGNMMVRQAVMAALSCVFVISCGKSPSDDMKGKVENVQDKVKDTAENVWSGQVKAIDKAKGVGKALMDAADDQRHKIEKESE